MNDIISKLYGGEIYPAEQFQPTLDSYKQKLQEYKNKTHSFQQSFTPEQQKIFDQIMDDNVTLSEHELSQVYSDGFKLGAQLMVEIYYNSTNS